MRTHINTFLILLIVLTAISTSCTSPKGKNVQGQITVEAPIVESCDSMPQDEIFQSVEELPEYPGGSKALMKYLNDSIRYPHILHYYHIFQVLHNPFDDSRHGTLECLFRSKKLS